jgi:hypothetical protein
MSDKPVRNLPAHPGEIQQHQQRPPASPEPPRHEDCFSHLAHEPHGTCPGLTRDCSCSSLKICESHKSAPQWDVAIRQAERSRVLAEIEKLRAEYGERITREAYASYCGGAINALDTLKQRLARMVGR